MTSVAELKQLGDHVINLIKPLDTNSIGKALYDLCDMADSFRCQEAWEEALECCRRGHKLINEMARRTSRNIDIDYCEGIVLLYEGTIYLSQGKNQAAEDCFRRSADTYSRIDLRNEGIAWLGLGITLDSKGDLARALEAYQLSLNAFNDILSDRRRSIRIEAVSRLERTRDRLQLDLEKRMKSRGSKQQKRISKTTPLLRLIPLCDGEAAAGKPLTIRDNIEGYISATEFQIGDEAFTLEVIQGTGSDPHISGINFAVKVKGDSMEPVIQNGEYVLVSRQADVDNGTIAVVRFRKDVGSEETEVTVKEYYKEKDHLLLQPKNVDAEWFVIVEKDEDENTVKARYQKQLQAGKLEIFIDPDPQIEGKVVGILKQSAGGEVLN
jgi:tetratricopeptide (TPR) repeat protein